MTTTNSKKWRRVDISFALATMSHQAVTLSALIPKNQNLVVLQYDSNVKHALEVLYGARITAVPVIHNKKLVGMLDVLDLVAFLAQMHKKQSNELSGSSERAGSEQLVVLNKEDTPEVLQKRSEEFLQTKVWNWFSKEDM
jgi:predicted transcriptional regulator